MKTEKHIMKITKASAVKGTLRLPGDKSISHRAALMAAIAQGTSKISNFSTSLDCQSTLKCLEKLGVSIVKENSTVLIEGRGKNALKRALTPLDCGNSGTTARLLAGILAGHDFESTLIGDESLSRRPMSRIIEPLQMMGAKIQAEDNHLPLKIYGKNPLKAISYKMKVASAQVKSCVLLAGLFCDGSTEVFEVVSEAGKLIETRDHTERMLEFFGAKINKERGHVVISGSSELQAKNFTVPCDISAAAFFLVAAACLEGSELYLPNVGINPTRNAIIKLLEQIGANIKINNIREECGEPVADLHLVSNSKSYHSPPPLRAEIIANLIDEIPILAILGTQLPEGLEIREASELRVKESDRIKMIVENLRLMNANVIEYPDGFSVKKSNLCGAQINSANDHRIAMAFAIAGLLAEGETIIDNSECVSISFPNFFEHLQRITER